MTTLHEPPVDEPTAEIGPRDVAAERACIGAMLLSRDAIAAVSEHAAPDDMTDPRHTAVYATILDLYDRGEPTDTITVTAALIDAGSITRAGGVSYLHTCVESVPVAANAAHFARIVADRATRRRLIEAGRAITAMAANPGTTLADITTEAQKALDGAVGLPTDHDMVVWGDLVGPGFDAIEQAKTAGKMRGLSTGLSDLDKLTLGMKPGELWIVAARPSIGKSVLATDLLRATCFRRDIPAALFSLEMTRDEIFKRIISAQSGVPHHVLTSGEVDDRDWQKLAAHQNLDAPLWINDSAGVGIGAIRTTARRLVQQRGIRLLIVDHLGLMGTPGSRTPRQEAVSDMSRALKVLAKDLGITVVMLCQLNRGPEARHDKKPQLSDLRESGSLEQDANVVILLHRPDFYDLDQRPGEADFLVEKNRGGPRGTVTVAAQLDRMRFTGFSFDDDPARS